MLVLEGLVGLNRNVQCFSSITGWGIDLDYFDIEWVPWKQTDVNLSFLRLYPSTAFQTLLLTLMAIPFLLRDSSPQ